VQARNEPAPFGFAFELSIDPPWTHLTLRT
jgi:hypothetical protein